MSCHAHHLAGMSGYRLSLGYLLAIDGVDDDCPRRLIQSDGRVTEERILELVHRDVSVTGSTLYQLILSQALRLTDGHGLSVLTAQHILQIGIIDQAVIVFIHRARCAEDCHGPTVIVSDRGYADIFRHTIERHNVASREDPQWQVLIRESFIIVEHQDLFVRQLCSTPVPAVVHDKRALSLLLLNQIGHFRIGVSGRRPHFGIGIPHHFLDAVSRMQGLHRCGSLFRIAHVDVVVAVVTHKHQRVLPVAGIGVLHVADGFVDHHLRVSLRGHGETADSHVTHVELSARVARSEVGALTVVEISEEAVIHITVDIVERVLALISQEEIVRIKALTIGSQHTVVPHTATEEQEILGCVLLRLCPVVEHLHIAPVGVGIRRSTRELIVELVSGHDVHAQRVMLLMKSSQALSLGKQFSRSGDNDDHVGLTVSMMILVGDIVHILGGRECAQEVRSRLRLIPGSRDIVETHGTARQHRNLHRIAQGSSVHGLTVGTAALIAMIIIMNGNTEVSHDFAIDAHLGRHS